MSSTIFFLFNVNKFSKPNPLLVSKSCPNLLIPKAPAFHLFLCFFLFVSFFVSLFLCFIVSFSPSFLPPPSLPSFFIFSDSASPLPLTSLCCRNPHHGVLLALHVQSFDPLSTLRHGSALPFGPCVNGAVLVQDTTRAGPEKGLWGRCEVVMAGARAVDADGEEAGEDGKGRGRCVILGG